MALVCWLELHCCYLHCMTSLALYDFTCSTQLYSLEVLSYLLKLHNLNLLTEYLSYFIMSAWVSLSLCETCKHERRTRPSPMLAAVSVKKVRLVTKTWKHGVPREGERVRRWAGSPKGLVSLRGQKGCEKGPNTLTQGAFSLSQRSL
jgi:hypothetical protein